MKLIEWQNTSKDFDDLIVQSSTYKSVDGWQPFPIGMSWQYMRNYQKGEAIQIGEHEKLVFCAVRAIDTYRRGDNGRVRFLETLKKNNIKNGIVNDSDYYDALPHYKFVISPEGLGFDCHRHYEALIAGCIPIMEYNPLIEKKYNDCPVLYTKDYSEINHKYLEAKYKEMIGKEYDFSCLFFSSYDEDKQKKIKECRNYWANHLKVPMHKFAVVTTVVGKRFDRIGEISVPLIKEYADKVGADFIKLTDFGSYWHPALCKLNIYNLLDEYERIIYFDSDTIIHPNTPNLFEVVDAELLGMFEENKYTNYHTAYRKFCDDLEVDHSQWNGNYYNSGVIVCSQKHKDIFDKTLSSKIGICEYYEQTPMNIMIMLRKFAVQDIGQKFNHMNMHDWAHRHKSYIIHYAGQKQPTEEALHSMKKDLGEWGVQVPVVPKRQMVVRNR